MRTMKLSMAEAMCEYREKDGEKFLMPRNIKILYNIWYGQSKKKVWQKS
ncbi:MAG: hypothetical protein FWG63_00845 [Defluviitaleaceae bacterium]|nr:hypothetical protein [Defluviitaleaceae bacterium]